MASIRRALVPAALLALALAGCNPLYHPRGIATEDAAADAGMAVVRYPTADGLTLGAWYRAARRGLPTLVYFHGNSGHHGDRAFLVKHYLDAGYGVLLAGYRGYGGNPGQPDEQGLYEDGRAAIDWVSESGVPVDRIVLFGESLGTGVAVQMALEHEIAGLVLQAAFTSAVDVGQHTLPLLPVGLLMTHRFDSLSKIDRIAAPLLVTHGEADSVIPARFGRQLFDAAPEPKTAYFIPGAGHNDLYRFGVSDMVIAWLRTLPLD